MPDASNLWCYSRDGDPAALALYERHYSCRRYRDGRRRRQFVGPGERMVFLTSERDSLFVWRRQRFRRDGQTGVCCSVFRNESKHRSSDLIRAAMRLGWERWPGERLFTFVDPRQVRSANPGYCFLQAGWNRCGSSKRRLVVLEVSPETGGVERTVIRSTPPISLTASSPSARTI